MINVIVIVNDVILFCYCSLLLLLLLSFPFKRKKCGKMKNNNTIMKVIVIYRGEEKKICLLFSFNCMCLVGKKKIKKEYKIEKKKFITSLFTVFLLFNHEI